MKQENKRNDYPKQIKTHFAFAFFNALLVKQAELVCVHGPNSTNKGNFTYRSCPIRTTL